MLLKFSFEKDGFVLPFRNHVGMKIKNSSDLKYIMNVSMIGNFLSNFTFNKFLL